MATLGLSCAARGGGAPPAAPPAAVTDRASAPPAASNAAPVEVARAALGTLSASKWQLGNGLSIILLADPQASSVSVMTWFRVGSRNEDEAAGETGLAHLFEHLMFTQTKGHEVGEFDRTIETAGGNANAMTYYDYTAYVNDLPPDELPVAVRLEADRMVNLDLRQRQIETERNVVVEERLAAVEDNVDGTLDEIMFKQAFKNHPYRLPVIGWLKDIKSVTPTKVVAFYRRFYAPNNAVLVITGRFEERAALALVTASHGGIPSSSSVPRDDARPERAPAAEVRTVLTRPVPADRFVVGFPGVGLAEADRAAYEVTNEVLTGGPSSRLHHQLVVDKQMASSVRGDVTATRDPGLFAVWVQMTKGHAAEDAEQILLATAADLASHDITPAELGKAQARLETALWRRLSGSHGRAELLGEFEVVAGDFRRLFARAGEYARVTASDVRRIAASYLAPGARSVVIARPKIGRDAPRAEGRRRGKRPS